MKNEQARRDDRVKDHDCGEEFLRYLCTLSPGWRAKVDALREERHLTAAQALGSLAAFALDTDQYLIVPDHPFFREEGIRPGGSTQLCPVCQKEWMLLYPGQPYCSNECAEKARALNRERAEAQNAGQ